MNRFIQNIIRKDSRKQKLLILELFVSFIALFIILLFTISCINNAQNPLGFNYKRVNLIGFQVPNDEYEVIDKNLKEIYKYLNIHPDIEAQGILSSSFFFQSGYRNPFNDLKYKKDVISAGKITSMLADDNVRKILDIKMIDGRWFSKEDNASKNRPCIISTSLKEMLMGKNNAIGEKIEYCEQQCIVVGVCSDFKHKGEYSDYENIIIVRNTQEESVQYETWDCMSGSNCGNNNLVKFSKNAPLSIQEEIIKSVYSKYPGYSIKFDSLEKKHNSYLQRTWIPLISIFCVVLFLFINVLFGLFGISWYKTSQRKSEIGLRMAIGATRRKIYWQFVNEMLIITTLGVIPGVIVAAQFPLLNILEVTSGVFVISILSAAIVVYLLVVLCAIIPSARAAKIQPAIALREE